ncbi:MAG: FAD-binding protein [Syntrophales bacterium]
MNSKPKISQEAKRMAEQCRHYAMCKIDYLGTGVCASGQEKHYVSYYPQGRMDIYAALAAGLIPVTEALIDIADACDLCGICDKQCHFYTEMKPSLVMAALKDYIEAHRKQGGKIEKPSVDDALKRLRSIVGEEWASNDPAILVTYADDPCPLTPMCMPRYVALPRTRGEVAGIVRLARELQIPMVVRGNGGSTAGFVFTDGVVIDLNRMKGMEIDRENWVAVVEAGVTSYDLQKEAARHGLRINAAEPAATVCGNIICSGTFSTWINAYGTAADNMVDAEFVAPDGSTFRLGEKTAPNLFAYKHEDVPSPGICTKAHVRLHPVTEDEEGVLVPFSSFAEAVAFSRELSMRRIGIAIAVLGEHYLSAFTSPTEELAKRVSPALTELLGIKYMVLVLGDRYAISAIRTMGRPVIDNALFRILALGLPRLAADDWQFFIRDLDWNQNAFELLAKEDMRPLLSAILSPSPENIASAVHDPDLRDFYTRLYAKPEMTDLVWLNTFRIVSARMSRRKHMFALILYVPLDKQQLIDDIIREFAGIAERHRITHHFGFLTPLDMGKRAILEYDYYCDQTNESEKKRIQEAMPELVPMIEGLCRDVKGVAWMKHIVSQGFSRKEQFLYT